MLIVVIYLLIGIAVLAGLIVLFVRMGTKEIQASPQHRWEKAIEEYGDQAIANLYKSATSDEEKEKIASFVEEKSPQKPPKEEMKSKPAPKLKSVMLEPEDLPQQYTNKPIEEKATPHEEREDEETKKDALNINSILKAPVYHFWQEPAVIDKPSNTDSTQIQSEQILTDDPFPNPEPLAEATYTPKAKPVTEAKHIQEQEQEQEPQPETDPAPISVTKDMIVLCPVCGNPVEDAYDFCIICGTKINETAKEAPPDLDETEPIIEEEAPIKPKKRFFGRRKAKQADLAQSQVIIAPLSHFTKPQTAPESKPMTPPTLCHICGAPIEKNCAFCIICGNPVLKKSTLTAETDAASSTITPNPKKNIDSPPSLDITLDKIDPDTPNPTNEEALYQTRYDFWNKEKNTQPIAGQPIGTAINSDDSRSQINSAPDQEAAAAYHTSTATAYTAAAARGLFETKNEDISLSHEQEIIPKEPDAQSPPLPIIAPDAVSEATIISPIDEKINAQELDEEYTSKEATLSLQNILTNVRALEERIFAEAEAATKSYPESKNDDKTLE